MRSRSHLVPTLICNGVDINCQPNLRLALRRIRQRNTRRVLWVDAICINQLCRQEQTEQVRMMGSIYRNSLGTVVWLGEGENEGAAQLGLGQVCRLVNGWDQACLAQYWTVDQHTGEEVQKSSNAVADWESLKSLFCTSWFERKWVIQETALAKSTVVMWGDCRTDWNWIGIAAAIIRTQHFEWAQSSHRMVSITLTSCSA